LTDDFSRFSDEHNETGSIRGGLRHAFSPNTTLLLSLPYQKRRTSFTDFVPATDPFFPIDFSIDLDVETSGYNGEAQLIHRQELAQYTAGWLESTQVVAGVGDVGNEVDEVSAQ